MIAEEEEEEEWGTVPSAVGRREEGSGPVEGLSCPDPTRREGGVVWGQQQQQQSRVCSPCVAASGMTAYERNRKACVRVTRTMSFGYAAIPFCPVLSSHQACPPFCPFFAASRGLLHTSGSAAASSALALAPPPRALVTEAGALGGGRVGVSGEDGGEGADDCSFLPTGILVVERAGDGA